MTNVHSQTNGQQGCSVTPSSSKNGSVGLDDLSGGTKKRGGGGRKDTMTHSSDSSLPDCSTTVSVLSQPWTAKSPTAIVGAAFGEQEKAGEDRASLGGERSSLIADRPASSSSSAAGPLTKPKRKPAPSKPGSAGMNATSSPIPENLTSPSPHPPSYSSVSSASTASTALMTSSPPPENPNTNRNNSTSLNQSPPPFTSSLFSTPHASPVPSLVFRDTPVLRRAPYTSSSAKYQTLPVEEGGRSRARRRYSLSEGGSKTHLSHQGGGGAPKLGRIMRNKRSQSMSGMLLPKDGDGDSDKGRCDSDWILESTV